MPYDHPTHADRLRSTAGSVIKAMHSVGYTHFNEGLIQRLLGAHFIARGIAYVHIEEMTPEHCWEAIIFLEALSASALRQARGYHSVDGVRGLDLGLFKTVLLVAASVLALNFLDAIEWPAYARGVKWGHPYVDSAPKSRSVLPSGHPEGKP